MSINPFHNFPPLFHLAAGIMEAVARELFDSKVTMVVLNQSREDERTGKREHVVFLVKQTKQSCKTIDQDQSSDREVGTCGSIYKVCLYMEYSGFLARLCFV